MRVNGTKTETVSIDISERDLIENAINLVASRADLYKRWIASGWVCEDEKGWRHGSVGTDKVREASDADVKNYQLITRLREFLMTLK